jgi:dicarboxylate/amino acid:cation (Na+ or H+) symporter, DAACS family
MKMGFKILIAMTLGIAAGLVFGPSVQYLQPIGTTFLNLLKMLIVPLVFSSLVVGVTSSDPKKLGRIGMKAMGLYLLSALLAISFGLIFTTFIGLGKGMAAPLIQQAAAKKLPSLIDLLLGIVPTNPIQALAEGNVMQIVIFAILFGVCLNMVGPKARPLIEIFEIVAKAMFKMTAIVMELAPYGVFALLAWSIGFLGIDVFVRTLSYLLAYWAAALIYTAFVHGGILLSFRLSPIRFYKAMAEALIMGASTCSSAATLPVTIECVTKNLGVSQKFANFALPLGLSLNLNGTSLFQAMAAIFIANVFGVDLSMQHYILIFATVLVSTYSCAGIPSGDLIMLSFILTAAGIPIEGIGILAAVDRLRDMATTVLNITGDSVVAYALAKAEGEIEEEGVISTLEPVLDPVSLEKN